MSDVIKFSKVVSALPGTLEKNTIYFVKSSNGVLAYVTNDLGLVVATPVTVDLSSKADLIHSHDLATTSLPGFMSAADKTKLDGISGGGSATTGQGDENVSTNVSLKELSRIREQSLVSLNFINEVYKGNTGNGRTDYSLTQLVASTRSNIISAVDQSLPVTDGLATFHNRLLVGTISATDIGSLTSDYTPSEYRAGGLYQYRGQWTARLEKRVPQHLVGSVAVGHSNNAISGGLLIEPNSVNLIAAPIGSHTAYTFTNVTGATSATSVGSVVPYLEMPDIVTLGLSPTNLTSGIKWIELTETAATGRHFAQRNSLGTVQSGQYYTWSLYVEVYGTADTVFLELGNAFPAAAYCSFIPTTVDSVTSLSATGQGAGCDSYSIEFIKQGLVRISITAQANANSVAHLIVGTNQATSSVAGDTSRLLRIFGEQFEKHQVPTSAIIPYSTTLNTRGSDQYAVSTSNDTFSYTSYLRNDIYEPNTIRPASSGQFWYLLHIDHLVNSVDHPDHRLLSLIDSTLSGEEIGFASITVTANIISTTEIEFSVYRDDPGTTSTSIANIDYRKPFTIALGVYYDGDTSADYLELLAHQQGIADSTVTSVMQLGEPGLFFYSGLIDAVWIGSAPASRVEPEPLTQSAYNLASMWGHVRNFEIYPYYVSRSNIETIMKNYDL